VPSLTREASTLAPEALILSTTSASVSPSSIVTSTGSSPAVVRVIVPALTGANLLVNWAERSFSARASSVMVRSYEPDEAAPLMVAVRTSSSPETALNARTFEVSDISSIMDFSSLSADVILPMLEIWS